ncbi:MAG: chemotaxis protein CheX [Spirochaetes bacterium]|nr:chemotaxis protein CheX [Spirochaetota bacterium]
MEDVVPGVFLEALRQVFGETGIRLDRVEPGRESRSNGPVEQVIASVGVTGEVRCNLMLCADNGSADGILRGMTAGLALPADRLGEFPRAAMGEIANQVAGRAVTLLAAFGRRCDITPPTVVTADRVDSLLPGPAAVWTVCGAFGVLRLIAAQERRKSS